MNSSSVQNTVELEAIRRELQLAEVPLKSTELSKRLKQKSGKAFKPTLDDEVKAGRIYSWGSNLYWDRDPKGTARERLLRVTARQLLSASHLKQQVGSESPKINQKVVNDVREELVREGSLREVPQRGSRTKFIVNVSNPEPYLESEIRRLLADFGIERSPERILSLLAPADPEPQVQMGSEPGTEPDVRAIAETMFAAMNRIAFAPGTTVTFYRLRQQPELKDVPREVFDQAALLLQKDHKVLLAVHDHAPRLAQSERDDLVTDGLGNYYVSIYAL
jgi:hypothetical protein